VENLCSPEGCIYIVSSLKLFTEYRMLRRKFGTKTDQIKRGYKIRRTKSFIAYTILRILFTISNHGWRYVQDTQLVWCSVENAHKLLAINLEGRGFLGNLGFTVQSPSCNWIRLWSCNMLVFVPYFYKCTIYHGMGRITVYSRKPNSLASYKLLHLFQEYKDAFSKKLWINGVFQLVTLVRHFNELRKQQKKFT
jgi:hypothetical protein